MSHRLYVFVNLSNFEAFSILFIEICIVIYWTECDTIIMLLSICHLDCNHSIVWIIFFCIFDVSIALCVFCHSSIYICALILLHYFL